MFNSNYFLLYLLTIDLSLISSIIQVLHNVTIIIILFFLFSTATYHLKKFNKYYYFVIEMLLPANANVYYAVNTAYNLNFILRPRKTQQVEPVVNGKSRGKRP